MTRSDVRGRGMTRSDVRVCHDVRGPAMTRSAARI